MEENKEAKNTIDEEFAKFLKDPKKIEEKEQEEPSYMKNPNSYRRYMTWLVENVKIMEKVNEDADMVNKILILTMREFGLDPDIFSPKLIAFMSTLCAKMYALRAYREEINKIS